MSEWLTALASIATALGVLLAAWQLRLSQRQGVTAFEDEPAREYRQLAATMPTRAFLGAELSDAEHQEHLDEFYHYFNLCNEQIFLHDQKRITDATWSNWDDGMQANFERPAFRRAWAEVARRSGGDFQELRQRFPPEPPPLS